MANQSVDIEIDVLTNCLIERKTGAIVRTTIEQIVVKKNEFSAWKFDWEHEAKRPSNILL